MGIILKRKSGNLIWFKNWIQLEVSRAVCNGQGVHIDVVTIELMSLTIYDKIEPLYSFRYEATPHFMERY